MTPEFRKAIWASLVAASLVGSSCRTTEICDDGIDNDDDELTDCDDPECGDSYYDYYYCPLEEDCASGVDDDNDGEVDCDDSDCDGDPECSEDGSGGSEPGTGGSDGSGGSEETGETGGASTGGSASGGLGGEPLGGAAGAGTGGIPSAICPAPSEALEGEGYVDVGSLADFTNFTASSCQTDGSGADIPLYYDVPMDGTLTVQTYSTYGDTDVSVRSTCGNPDSELPLACAADVGAGMQETLELEVEANETLYIIVSGANSSVTANAYLQLQLE